MIFCILQNMKLTENFSKQEFDCHDGSEMEVFTGDDIKKMSDKKLKEILKSCSIIFSRVSPEDKYRIVDTLQKAGHFTRDCE